jgi:hypothetical protein
VVTSEESTRAIGIGGGISESREDEQRAAEGLPWLRSPRLTEEPSLDYFFDAFSLVQTMVFIEQTFFLLLTDLPNRKIIS